LRRLEYHEVNIQKGAIIGDMRRTKATIGELEDDVKGLTKRLDDIRCEHDETVALVSIQCETLALQEDALQNWRDQIDVFFWVEAIKDAEASRKEYADRYEALLAKWNAFVPEYNEVVAQKKRNFGRPPAASNAQAARDQSLRSIAEDINIGVRTLRTIIDKKDGVDRATQARLERIAPDRITTTKQRALQRKLAGIPQRLKRLLKDMDRLTADLDKRAKGVK
jgi:septation ring formation regulator EzrA